MKPSELGSRFRRSIEAKGGDPRAPAVTLAVDAFIDELSEPAEGRHEDVLLFEVFKERKLDHPDERGDVVAVLDRQLFFGDPAKVQTLIVQWTFDDDPVLAEREVQIMGRGPGLVAAEGMVDAQDFIRGLRTAPALERMVQLKPKHIKVWEEQRDEY